MAGGALGEELAQLFVDAFGGNEMNFVGVLSNGFAGVRLDAVVEARGEADGAEHAEFVFGEAAFGFTNGADEVGFKILLAAYVVEDFLCVVAHEEAVDGEVAAGHVFLRRFGVDDLIGVAAVGVAEVVAEGGDLDFAVFALDEDYAELSAYGEAVGEELEDAIGVGVRGDVKIGGFAVEEEIANAAAHEEGLVAVLLESDADGVGELARVHLVIMLQVHRKVGSRYLVVGSGKLLAQEAVAGNLDSRKDFTLRSFGTQKARPSG